jgi:hypothetical protein
MRRNQKKPGLDQSFNKHCRGRLDRFAKGSTANGDAGFKETMMYTYSHGGDSGLVIFAAPDSIIAGTALNIAISEMPFRSSIERDDNLRNAILIFVGAQ